MVQLINHAVCLSKNPSVRHFGQLILCVAKLVLKTVELLVFGIKQVLQVIDLLAQVLSPCAHFDLTLLYYLPTELLHDLTQVLSSDQHALPARYVVH